MLRFLFTYLLFLSTAFQLNAQNITFEAEVNKTEISVNERLLVQFILTSQEKIHLDAPMDLPNFGGLQHLGTSQINRVQYENGNMTQLFGIESVLVADQEGEYTISPATVSINGKKHQTQPIKIKVSRGLKPEVKGGQRLQGAFITTEISTTQPYLNQEVILVVKAYVRDYTLLHRLRNFQEPDFSNVVAKYVSEKSPNHEKQVLINGNTFISKELARYIILPQKIGELNLNPFSIDVLISGYYGAEAMTLSSDPLRLNVRDLPENRPKSFQGAVGEFTMNTSLSKNKVQQEESLHFEVEIIGSGNLNEMQMPTIDLPEHLESYAPNKRNAFEARPSGLKGKIVENIILVPQYGGDYTIAPITFSYFDPEKSKYITLKSKEFHLEVEGESPPVIDSTQQLTHLDQISPDIETAVEPPLSILPKKLQNAGTQVVDNVWMNFNNVLIAILSLLILMGLWLWLRNQNRKRKSSERFAQKERDKQFQMKVERDLKSLRQLAKEANGPEFLSLEENLLTQIGMHYAQIQLADFTAESVKEKLSLTNESFAKKWYVLFLNCKQSKYAAMGENFDLNEKHLELVHLWQSIKQSK